MKNICPDCGKSILAKQYRYVIRVGSQVYYGFERIHNNGSFLASRGYVMHGHYPAPRIVTPSGNVVIENEMGTINVLEMP